MRNGQRCSSAKAYLVPADDRANLDIVTHAFVEKVLIRDKKSVEVKFKHGGSTHIVSARREVILSAGTINTSQLLMLSRIGPKKHLEDLQIPVKTDLRVGENLQDHQAVPVPFQIDPSIPSILQKGSEPPRS
ncbi:hypothetical protein JTE90_000098 [Oedothorax gibbosus]|uniref:Glucose-methanol-choline oxidoreductase N-terminal domain-containing protein n=1 Tax=Oedothorax gibbosus TaxID=931172 RepID=A0AAV6TS09_9ARAC|nr:hypothetical protein JTE90_000098 [Oedothorax gibbosus]